jgi:hypothetical protein
MKVINLEDGYCNRIRPYLDSYLNNELLVETNHEVLKHIEACAACSQSLEDRVRIKSQLKRAVMQDHAPVALRERISSDMRGRRGFKFNSFSFVLAAAAAMLVIMLTTFFTLNSRTKPLSLQAHVATNDFEGQVLKIGFEDHVFCAIDHQLANRQFTAEQMSEKLGPEYAGLIDVVRAKMPKPFTVIVGHRCHYQEREFVHLIMRNQSEVVSLIITRKNGESYGDAATTMQAAGVQIHQSDWHNIQVAGMETKDFLVFVVSNEPKQETASIASSLAPSVRDFLARLEA